MISSPDTYPTAAQESTNHSGVSWGAIFAGAAGSAALAMILLLLGVGLGFSAMSPWADSGMSAKGIGISTVAWLAFTQIVASGLGGYIAGRLRVKWANLHGDEVYFRDTAHGFLSWAIATLVAATLIVGSVSSIVGGGIKAGASVASGAAGAVTQVAGSAASNSNVSSDDYGYFIDSLFRDDRPAAVSDDAAHAVVVRIFAKTINNGGQLSAEDRSYLAQLIAQRTNLSQADAERRVDQVYAQALKSYEDAKLAAKNAAETAAKVASMTALWTFVSLLCGAFFASLAAIWGGRRRDAVTYLEARPYTTTTTTAR
ncbi:putative transmembrane protein [Paucimonas lemoignei]|nr:putative transmembrane protein [Paucimonas lemoignei]